LFLNLIRCKLSINILNIEQGLTNSEDDFRQPPGYLNSSLKSTEPLY
jgi:hypothetical protein